MEPTSTLMMLTSLVGIAAFIGAMILLLNLVSEAFNKTKGPRSVIIGLTALFYPIGTYRYCKENWEQEGKRFKIITALLSVGLITMIVSKVV